MSEAPKEKLIPMQRVGGLVTDMLTLPPDEITPELVAHALSMKNRFTGHARKPYNVAQHCYEGAKRIAGPFKLPFLLHELDETFLQDIHGPLKPRVYIDTTGGFKDGHSCAGLVSWTEIGKRHAKVILGALRLSALEPLLDSEQVKAMDWAMLKSERDLFMDLPRPTDGADWWFPEGTQNVEGWEGIAPMDAAEAEFNWLDLYRRLVRA